MIFRISICFLLFTLVIPGYTQEKLAPDVYLVKFKDKTYNAFQISNPSNFLSERALSRRQRQNIALAENDLPVSGSYVDSIKKLGLKVLNTSKWLNAISVETTNPLLLEKLKQISFVVPATGSTAKSTKQTIKKKQFALSPDVSFTPEYYGASYGQIVMHQGDFLHTKGYRGQNMLIAVMDGGFENVRNMTSLDSLWDENRMVLSRDIYGAGLLYNDNHGAMVLSIMAGNMPGSFVGTAPKASYALFRSEDGTYNEQGIQREFLIEEFNWVVAAELADSIGADIINTSLGYSTFNDPRMNHTYNDMNGKTTMVSRGATVAASKGMIVVVSAGNEGGDPWTYITAPADADSILTIGAVNSSGERVYFSSIGPTADKRIKPDVMATGGGTVVQTPANAIVKGNGTSFSAPVISGLVACLWQAAPEKTNLEIIHAVKQASSKYNNPDNFMGYGIPDFKEAYFLLYPEKRKLGKEMLVWPNPFHDHIFINVSGSAYETALISIYNTKGQKAFEKSMSIIPHEPNTIELKDLASLPKGMYLVRVINGSINTNFKVLKQ